MSNKKFNTYNFKETQQLAKEFAKQILWQGPKKSAIIVSLAGDLGSGKTTFVQGFADGAGVKEKILSPTFNIIKKFNICNSKFKNFYHIDAYRLNSPQELLDLGLADLIKNPQNIILIEWADKVMGVLPSETIFIKFFHGKIENERELAVSDRGSADEAE